MENETISAKAKMLIAVAALGYFVDVYDLILFSVVRNPSLMSFSTTSGTVATRFSPANVSAGMPIRMEPLL